MQWSEKKIKEWISSQESWYQTIQINERIKTPGKVDSIKRLKIMNLPDLTGKTVLDVGCNSGMYSFQAKRQNAAYVVGIDVNKNRLYQARTLNDILGYDIEFKEHSIYELAELGKFDYVFCIAVLTEITNIIDALTGLRNATKEVLYLELALSKTYSKVVKFVNSITGTDCLEPFGSNGIACLRKTKHGWFFAPDMNLLEHLTDNKFKIFNLGSSVRYSLVKLIRK